MLHEAAELAALNSQNNSGVVTPELEALTVQLMEPPCVDVPSAVLRLQAIPNQA